MYDIPTILSSEELIDKAFRRASKITIAEKNRLFRAKKTSISKLDSVSNTINSTLQKYVNKFPSLDNIPLFYQELIDVLVGVDELKHSLGAIDWCRKKVEEVKKEGVKKIKRHRNIGEINSEQRAIYGRISSILRQVSKELEFLSKARRELRKMPSIDASLPTIVVAGYPNVGKSLLVKQISSAKPKIDTYPFTTQGINIGYFERGYQRYQVIDTPGLLDREFSERNDIEKQAIVALTHLAHVIIFLLDPTESCGYEMRAQIHLLDTIKKIFSGIPILEIENKADLLKTKTGRQHISALTGENIDELVSRVLEVI